jgi:hypothetical protein
MHFMQLRALLPTGHRHVLYTLKISTTLIVVVDTGGKYAAGVVDTNVKFTAGVVDTGGAS